MKFKAVLSEIQSETKTLIGALQKFVAAMDKEKAQNSKASMERRLMGSYLAAKEAAKSKSPIAVQKAGISAVTNLTKISGSKDIYEPFSSIHNELKKALESFTRKTLSEGTKTFLVKHDFNKSRPRTWTTFYSDLFGKRNEGFEIKASSVEEVKKILKGRPHNLNPFYLDIKEK